MKYTFNCVEEHGGNVLVFLDSGRYKRECRLKGKQFDAVKAKYAWVPDRVGDLLSMRRRRSLQP